MNYPTDQLKRGQFIQKYAGSTWPIEVTTNSTSINPQLPTTQSTISTNYTSNNLSSGSVGTAGTEFDSGMRIQSHENNFFDTPCTSMPISPTQEHRSPYAISNFSSTPANPRSSEALWHVPGDDAFQAPFNEQIQVGGVDEPVFAVHQTTPGSSRTRGIPPG